jgi:nitrile hydratase accessory protein
MQTSPPSPDLPDLPADASGPVFNAPWEAQAFALAVRLEAQGVFTWSEWAERLGAAIREAQARGDPDLGNTYYHHWLAALEALVIEKGLASAPRLAERRETIRLELEHARAEQSHHDHDREH